MNTPTQAATLILLALLSPGCGGKQVDEARLRVNDANFDRVATNATAFTKVAEVDHARLAHKAGENQMPPSRVLIFSNPKVTTPLLQVNPRLGLDLPYRVPADADKGIPVVAFADASFLRKEVPMAVTECAYTSPIWYDS